MNPTRRTLAVTWGTCLALHAAVMAPANQVTYQVDMAIQTAIGNFNPDADGVLVAGNFNGWAMVSLTNVPGSSLYRNTFTNPLAAGQWENHKFIIAPAASEEVWESIPDRFFQVTADDQVLPVVFFNDQEAPPVVTQVTWSVDMSVQTELGTFEPFWDEVFVAGDMNGWEIYTGVLTPSATDTNVWTGTFDVENNVGATVNYKFVMLNITGEVWERDNLGPGGARNRQFTFTNEVTSLPVVFFNDETVSAVVTQDVTFAVSLAAQSAHGAVPPTSMSVAGDMTSWSMVELTQIPTDPTAWSGTLEVTGNRDGVIAYKFVYAGPAGEEVWEDDDVGGTDGPRHLTLTGDDTLLPLAHFNDIEDLGALTIRPASGAQVTLEWTGGPLIRLQAGSSLSGTYDDVPDTQGISTINLNLGANEAYYRLIGP